MEMFVSWIVLAEIREELESPQVNLIPYKSQESFHSTRCIKDRDMFAGS